MSSESGVMVADSAVVFDCQNIGVEYGHVKAVDGLNLKIHKGERVAILGSNGAGKTSLLSVASGMRTATRGAIRILGEKPGALACKQRMTYLPQVLTYPSHLRVKEIFALIESHYPGSDWRGLVERLELEKLLDRRTSQLSGGENRKLGVVSSFMSQPELVILDEPTANIDIEGCRSIESLIEAYFEGGNKTLIFSSHLMNEVESLATRIVVMKNGRIVAEGPKDQIKKQFGLRKLSFRSASENLELQSAKKRDVQNDLYQFLGEDRDAMIKEALAADSNLCDINVSDPDLEEILMKLWSDEPTEVAQ
jgi:ABC-2 type transport system ATP-binding protein